MMSTSKQLVLVNVAVIIGIAISLFGVPGSTPLWLWASVAAVFLAVSNLLLVVRRGGTVVRAPRSTRTIVISVGAALLFIDIVLSRLFK